MKSTLARELDSKALNDLVRKYDFIKEKVDLWINGDISDKKLVLYLSDTFKGMDAIIRLLL